MRNISFLTRLPIGIALLFGQAALAMPYGTAGCGIGALAFEDKPGQVQIFAATLNNLISPQTSAITSGTSNCYDAPDTKVAMFLIVNEQALRTDISRGEGDALSGLSQIMNCKDSQALGITLQKNYESIFPAESVDAKAAQQAIQGAVRSNPELASQCGSV